MYQCINSHLIVGLVSHGLCGFVTYFILTYGDIKKYTKKRKLLTFFARSCHVIVCGGRFARVRARRQASVQPCLDLLDLLDWLDWFLCLTWPDWWVGGIHAAPHAAAKLQAPHVPHHGGGIEGLLAAGRKSWKREPDMWLIFKAQCVSLNSFEYDISK